MAEERRQMEELTLKFGKRFAEDFTGKDGKVYKRIRIANADKEDRSPWASFVLPARMVHENQYGSGLWAKIPADGQTTVTKPERAVNDDGEKVWVNRQYTVRNADLKAMVEDYKTRNPQRREAGNRESARQKLDALVKETADSLSPERKFAKARGNGPEH